MTPDQYLENFSDGAQAIINIYAISYENKYAKRNAVSAKEFLDNSREEVAKR